MTNLQAVILGVIQGLTEYLPVSSSAHLVIVPKMMGWQFPPKEAFFFDVLVQLGTLVGVFLYFFVPIRQVVISVITGVLKKDLFYNEDARLGWLVVLATIPAGVVGLLFKESVAGYFASPLFACCFLVITGILLILAETFTTPQKNDNPTRSDAVIIGISQSLALLPGISRSGATISAGMACGLSRKKAAQFSFLMSIPVMLGASLVMSLDLVRDPALLHTLAVPLLLGFVSAAISGYLVIKWFMAFLVNQRLIWFAAYCIGIGLFGAFFFS